ncbi:segregation/condensation protein A [Candidatus Woesearchaeota archaeon]|nr:segregation/condensation protein A [Candidatus Woesearchaeota archaeon]
MQDRLFNMLFKEDELTWQNIIYDLVKKEEMNPWDIEISLLAKRFLEMVKKLKEMDFRISGKIILAAAILLRIKSNRLVGEDLNQLNRLIAMSEATEEELYDAIEDEFSDEFSAAPIQVGDERFRLIPRTPQPRKRKVSVYDLVDALEKALEVNKRRNRLRESEIEVHIPEKQTDISKIIFDVYYNIKDYFLKNKKKRMTFSELVPSENREDMIYAFLPLLHLDFQRRIDIMQKEHLGEIEFTINRKYDAPEAVKEEVAELF